MLVNDSALPILGVFVVNNADKVSALFAQAWDKTWDIALDTTLYQVITNVGRFFAVSTILIWLFTFFRELLEDGISRKVSSELIWPILVIYFLSGSGQNLASFTKGMRYIINETNQAVLTAVATATGPVNSTIDIQARLATIVDHAAVEQQIAAVRAECNTKTTNQDLIDCLQQAQVRANEILDQFRNAHPPSTWLDAISNQLQTTITDPLTALQNAVNGTSNAISNSFNTVLKTAVDILPMTIVIETLILAFQAAFQAAVEIALLLTALMGPIALGASLLPIGGKPIYAWLTGFWSLGICKLSLNIITALVATAFYEAGPIDTLRILITIGLFAPIFALALAAGGGMAIFNAITATASAAASTGLNIGLRFIGRG